jgi:hypothetical protein
MESEGWIRTIQVKQKEAADSPEKNTPLPSADNYRLALET